MKIKSTFLSAILGLIFTATLFVVPSIVTAISAPTLDSIDITTPATKLTYLVGETLDITGMVVVGNYSDDNSSIVTVTLGDVSGFDSSVPVVGQTLTITIDGKTATYAVTVEAAPVPAAPTPAPASGGGGGGGGGGGSASGIINLPPVPASNQSNEPTVSVVASTTTPLGRVLGASTFNFTQNLSLGSTGEEVTKLQERLLAEGLLASDVKPTGYFGPLTEDAVKKFQELHGIEMTGTVGPKTRAALNGGAQEASTSGSVLGASTFKFTQNLSLGSTGEEVTKLQERLVALGLLSVEPTGYFGPLTEAAVKQFQTQNGIEAIGIVGPKTRAALNK